MQSAPSSPVPGLSGLTVIARGGYSTVYSARQDSVGREVALKIDTRSLDEERDRRRFLREAEAAGRMSGHPHVVNVYDAGVTDDNHPYLVMELCTGGSYATRLKAHGRLPAGEVRDVGVKIADALEAAHQAGVLHRDVKPGNILINRYGVPGLADFGLAALPDPSRELSVTIEALTPAYAPPEVYRLDRPGPLGDVYSLAASLYAMLSGRPPRWPDTGTPSLATMVRLLDEPVPDIPGVPSRLTEVLRQAMASDPADRYPSAASFRDALAAVPLGADGDAGAAAPGAAEAATVPTPGGRFAASGPFTPSAPSAPSTRGPGAPTQPVSAAPSASSAPSAPSRPLSAPPPAATGPWGAQPPPPHAPSSPYARPGGFPASPYQAAAGPPPRPPVTGPPRTSGGYLPPPGTWAPPGGPPPPSPSRRGRIALIAGGVALAVVLLVVGGAGLASWVGNDPRSPSPSSVADDSPSPTPGVTTPSLGGFPLDLPTGQPAGNLCDTAARAANLVTGLSARCPDSAECWGQVRGVAAERASCTQRHSFETWVIGTLVVGTDATEASRVRNDRNVEVLCSDSILDVLLAQGGQDDSGWKVEVLAPIGGGREFRCVAGKGTDQLTAPIFVRT